jgi:hypothetical protein
MTILSLARKMSANDLDEFLASFFLSQRMMTIRTAIAKAVKII